MGAAEPLIAIENLRVDFAQDGQRAIALRGVDISLYKDEVH